MILNLPLLKFQGFNWESWRKQWYLDLAPKAADLSRCGVTAVWLPPPTDSVAPQGLALCFSFLCLCHCLLINAHTPFLRK
jgi:hypothetical protein